MSHTQTITNELPGIIGAAWDEVLEVLERWTKENPDAIYCPDWSDLDYSGELHELIDGWVPVYYGEQAELLYFHGREALALLDEQFGPTTDDDWPIDRQSAAIYCLIQSRLQDRYNDEADEVWETFVEAV